MWGQKAYANTSFINGLDFQFNREQTDSEQGGVGRGITGERRGRVNSKNMYKRPMDKDNG